MEKYQFCAKEQYALVVCDLQADLLGSLSISSRKSLLTALLPTIEAARCAGWLVVFSGLLFPSGYVGVSPRHKLYGGLQRLNSKLGDEAVHWFMEGFDGANIETSLIQEGVDVVVWRQTHMPHELAECLKERGITQVTITGIKAGMAVQAACQLLCDEGMQVSVIRDCVQDDNPDRLAAVLDHLLPVYGKIISMSEMIDDAMGMDIFFEMASETSRQALIEHFSSGGNGNDGGKSSSFLCTDCERGGHGTRFIQLFLERPGWHTYPTQAWYGRMMEGEFLCPLGKQVVDFSDEPEFSKTSMFLAGREWLDEKDKVVQFAADCMPETFCLKDGTWVDGRHPPADSEEDAMSAPWFVKEADKNLGGDAIGICNKPSEVMDLTKPDRRYVVQQHVRDPLLTDDGKKCHLKFYCLLVCEQDGVSWTLYTYKSVLLSISPNRWSPEDLSQETQVTIHRHPVPPGETEGWKQYWPGMYEKCKSATAKVIKRAVTEGKLKGRDRKKQFEVFSADWMPDAHGRVWLFEFNMSPAVCQKEFEDSRNRDARRDTLMVHDEKMLRDALSIVFPWEGGTGPGLWDVAAEEFTMDTAGTEKPAP